MLGDRRGMIKALLLLPLLALGGCCVEIKVQIPATPEQNKNGRENFTYPKDAPFQYPSVSSYGKVESVFSPAWNTKASGTAGRGGSPSSQGESVTSCRTTESARASRPPFRSSSSSSIYSSMGRSKNGPSGEECMSVPSSEETGIIQHEDSRHGPSSFSGPWWYLQKKRGQ